MNGRRILGNVLVLVLLLALSAGICQAQSPVEGAQATGGETTEELAGSDDGAPALPDEELGEAGADPWLMLDQVVEPEILAPAAAKPEEIDQAQELVGLNATMNDVIPIQGRLTNAAGSPITGSRSVQMTIYNAATGGAALCIDTDTVQVSRGLFTADMDFCTAADLDGSQQLYLGIKVGADPEMTPRQPLYATPFAHGLRPGAIINQTSTGHALKLQAAGSDAPLVAENSGTGPLFKAFGAGGGEDEFRIDNNGAVETKADSYLWIPGNVLVKNLNTDTTRWDVQANGAVRVWRGATAGQKTVYFPVTIPAVLYGQPVKIERVTVFYRCQDGSKNYITQTDVNKFVDADSWASIIGSVTDRTSNTATSYTIVATQNNQLSAVQGGLGIYLYLAFADNTNYVQIGGVRLQLGHHDLY